MEFRVFRIVYLGESRPVYEYRGRSTRDLMTFRVSSDLASLAATLREEVFKNWGNSDSGDLAVTNFVPFNDMEHFPGRPPNLCLPLTKEEQAEFWRAYNLP